MTSHRMRRGVGERLVEAVIDLGCEECTDIFLAGRVMMDMLGRGRADEWLWRSKAVECVCSQALTG